MNNYLTRALQNLKKSRKTRKIIKKSLRTCKRTEGRALFYKLDTPVNWKSVTNLRKEFSNRKYHPITVHLYNGHPNLNNLITTSTIWVTIDKGGWNVFLYSPNALYKYKFEKETDTIGRVFREFVA